MQQQQRPLKYSVLYYKRTNKVHKNRGVSREDGILTISPPPSCLCKLVSAEEDDDGDNTNNATTSKSALDSSSDEDDDDDDTTTNNKFTKKKKYHQMRKKKMNNGSSHKSKSGVIFSGVNSDLSRRAFDSQRVGIHVDDALVLSGQWECEIVSVLNDGGGNDNNDGGGGGGMMNGIIKSNAAAAVGGGGMLKKNNGGLSSSGSSSLMRKQPSIRLGGKGALGGGNKTSRAPLGSLRKNTTTIKQPLQSKKKIGLGSGRIGSTGGVGVKRTLGATTAAKLPPTSTAEAAAGAGKMKKDKNGEWYLDKPDESDDDEEEDESSSALAASRTSKVPASLMRSSLGHKRPRITASSLGGSSSLAARSSLKSNNNTQSSAAAATKNDNDFFPGAKGERINVHASIRNILRPHQREGIAFLWNCVTGVNEGLKSAYTKSNSGKNDESCSDDECDGDKKMAAGKLEGVPRGAVLADEMGLGKVSFACCNVDFLFFWLIFVCNCTIFHISCSNNQSRTQTQTLMTISTIFAYHRLHRDRRFIVVCPSSLVSNWSKEFDKWLGKASQPKRVVVRNGAESEGLRNLKSFVPLKPAQSEVLILSYELFRMHVKVINKAQKIGLLVVDEGHRLKNTSGSQILTALNSIHVEARILITGTPIQVCFYLCILDSREECICCMRLTTFSSFCRITSLSFTM